MEKMTIHRALAELKLIDAKIQKAIDEVQPVEIHQKDKKIGGYMTQDEFKSQAESKYQSAIDLISRRTTIKSVIVKSNATTTLKVGEKEMTVANAITEKGNIASKKTLINILQARFKAATSRLNQQNEIVNKNCQIILEHTFGKDNTKVAASDMDSVRKPFMDSNEFHLFDPLKIQDKIAGMEKEVSEFEANIDAALSESNAVTFIEI